MATIRDVAKNCGVSAMTVSAVLNNRSGKVSADTRTRILRVVEEMGYQPNAVARGLTRRRMNTLGVVLSYEGKISLTSDRYFSPILDGIFAASKMHRQRTLIITEDTWEDVQKNLLNYMDGHCDGLIFILPIMPTSAYDGFLKRNIPFVIIGESLEKPELSTIDIDNVQAGSDATRHLIRQGHRRIGLLKGESFLLSTIQREQGFRQAHVEAGIALDEQLVIPGAYSAASGYERTRELLDERPASFPTAFFCGDDAIAAGAWRALAEQGLRIPEDVSLIGVNDDKEIVHQWEPGLTTIRQPLNELGQKATEAALAQIAGEARPGVKFLSRGELIVRGSVAPPVPTEPELDQSHYIIQAKMPDER